MIKLDVGSSLAIYLGNLPYKWHVILFGVVQFEGLRSFEHNSFYQAQTPLVWVIVLWCSEPVH